MRTTLLAALVALLSTAALAGPNDNEPWNPLSSNYQGPTARGPQYGVGIPESIRIAVAAHRAGTRNCQVQNCTSSQFMAYFRAVGPLSADELLRNGGSNSSNNRSTRAPNRFGPGGYGR
jgi:hypothetical protein